MWAGNTVDLLYGLMSGCISQGSQLICFSSFAFVIQRYKSAKGRLVDCFAQCALYQGPSVGEFRPQRRSTEQPANTFMIDTNLVQSRPWYSGELACQVVPSRCFVRLVNIARRHQCARRLQHDRQHMYFKLDLTSF